jgi:hypothetical protein
MLREMTSYQLSELEAFLRVEANPTTPEMEAKSRAQAMKDVFARFKPTVEREAQ